MKINKCSHVLFMFGPIVVLYLAILYVKGLKDSGKQDTADVLRRYGLPSIPICLNEKLKATRKEARSILHSNTSGNENLMKTPLVVERKRTQVGLHLLEEY